MSSIVDSLNSYISERIGVIDHFAVNAFVMKGFRIAYGVKLGICAEIARIGCPNGKILPA